MDYQYCNGKMCLSYREAHERMNTTRKRQHFVHSKTIPKRAYKCDVCGYYHLTHHAKPHDERDI